MLKIIVSKYDLIDKHDKGRYIKMTLMKGNETMKDSLMIQKEVDLPKLRGILDKRKGIYPKLSGRVYYSHDEWTP